MPNKYPVIIIEDDLDDQDMLAEISHELRADTTIHRFSNGAEALQYLEVTEEQPFIILCDVNMPKMTGLELLATIQGSPYLKNKAIPFVLLSTSGDKRYVERAYELSVQGFFQKPSDLRELENILRIAFEFWDRSLHPRHPVFLKG